MTPFRLPIPYGVDEVVLPEEKMYLCEAALTSHTKSFESLSLTDRTVLQSQFITMPTDDVTVSGSKATHI
jgi:hypothetical protein